MDEQGSDGPTPVARELTARQRFAHYMLTYLANDLDRGVVDEQHTAALLHLAADAIQQGYQGEMVALVRAWAWEREV